MKRWPLILTVMLLSFIYLTLVFAIPQIDTSTPSGLSFNNSNPHRGDIIKAYVNWTETVNSSFISYSNSTGVMPIINYTTGNETSDSTWTNFTIWTNITGALGPYNVTIYVNSTEESGGGPAELNYTSANYTLWGWVKTSVSLSLNPMILGYSTRINCTVTDANTTNPIANYNVSIYDNSTLINHSLSGSDGSVLYTHTPWSSGIHTITCAIFDNATAYYNVSYNATTPLNVAGLWSFPNKSFSVYPAILRLNWTNVDASNNYKANVTIIANKTFTNNITVVILNSTTSYPDSGLTPNYTQGFPSTDCERIALFVINSAGEYNNTIGPLNGSSSYNSTNVTLVNTHLECYPGRYYTSRFTIKNLTSEDNANITIYLDIPISISNTLNNATRTGSFNGQMPANSTTYHSFFFNATSATTGEIANATGIFINLTSYPSDTDLFLFDSSGNLVAKSINKTGNESLLYAYLPSNSQMWEIRVYGNHTSPITYRGNIIFTTLNITNSSGSTISQINFGTLNITDNRTTEIQLINEGNLSLSNVVESKELYYVKKFSGNGATNFTFLVSDSSITNRLKASLIWFGASNYSFRLFNHNGVLVGSSTGKHAYANITGAPKEEYLEVTEIGSMAKFWEIQVINNTASNDAYNITVYLYVNSSQWISTNYTSQTLNRTGGIGTQNYSVGVQINLSIPSNKAMNGTYEGYIQYLDNKRVGIKLPIRFDIKAAMLVVNNSMNSGTYRLDEDYGANLTRSMYFNISNPGFYNLSLNFTDTGRLTSSGWSANFSYNKTSWVPPNSYTVIRVNITFNSSIPKNTFLTGSITINGTNNSANLTAQPYALYTINLQLNLTDLLDVRIDFRSADWSDKLIYNSSKAENITIKTDIYYLNNTGPIVDLAGLSNFSYVWLQERNVSGSEGNVNLTFYKGRVPIYGSLAGSPWTGNYYYVNATVPPNIPGGLYDVYLAVNYTRDSNAHTYSGQGVNGTLIINNTGLHMSTNASSCNFGSSCNPSLSITNASTYRFFVNVSNYGIWYNYAATIEFSESCGGYSASNPTYSSTCSGFNVPPQNTSCLVYWDISAGTSAASACTAYIIGTPANQWFNPRGINVSITVTAPSGDTVEGDTTTGGEITPYYEGKLAFTKAESLIVVKQNSTNTTTVVVKNTGNKSQTVTFSVEDINVSWYSINSTSASIATGKEAAFKVTFSVGKVEIKDYSGKYKATSSDTSVTSNFTLRVLPSEEEEVMIADTLALYKLNMTNLADEINQSKTTGVDVSKAEAKLSELKTKIEEAEDYIDKGDYFSAYQLFDEIETLMADVKNELETAKKEFEEKARLKWITIIAVIAGLAIAGILLYLFWPTKTGYQPKKGKYIFKPSKENRMKDAWERLKEKWSKSKSTKPLLDRLKEKLTQIFKRKK